MAFGRGRGGGGGVMRGRGMGWRGAGRPAGRARGYQSASSSAPRGRGGAVRRGRGGQPWQPPQAPAKRFRDNNTDEDDADDDDDENAPPMAHSARRAQGDSDAEDEEATRDAAAARHAVPHRTKPQRAQLQRPPLRSHNEKGGARKDTTAAPRPLTVATVLTANQTELPQKLNTKIFIDGLPYQHQPAPGKPTLEQELIDFAAAWKVGKALRLIKKPGQGFGFLVFKSPHSVPLAVRFLNGRQFLGRALRVEEPKPRDLAQMQGGDAGSARPPSGKESFQRQVLISDLAKVTQPEIVREVLRDVAPQLEKKLETIKMTSRNRKAFLTFATPDDVAPAVRFLNGFHLLGRSISATAAAPPGALPYSHPHSVAAASRQAAMGEGTTAPSISKPAAMGNEDSKDNDEDDDEVAVVPLGLKPEPSSTRAQRREAMRKLTTTTSATTPAETAAQAAARSNVTGRTEKYNLLDDGPADIYVGNLTEAITEAQLREHFAPCGTITRCALLAHPETHLPTGIAHVVFSLPAYAAYAQAHYHGSQLRGCVLRVDRGDHASPALVSETGAANAPDEEEVYDEDAFLARRGIRNKEAYFRNTSLAADVPPADTARPAKRARPAPKEASEDGDARPDKKKTKKAAKTPVKEITDEDAGGDDEDDDDGEKDADLALAGMLGSDDDDEEEERFYDVDAVTRPAVTKPTKEARGKAAKGKGLDKAARKKSAHAKR